MTDGKGDIDLDVNKCGIVYEMRLDGNYNVSKMVPVVTGHGYNKNNAPNACATDAIANPDNLIIRAGGTVVIGEDTDKHENTAIWQWKR